MHKYEYYYSLIQIKVIFWHQKLQIMLYTLKDSGLYHSEKKTRLLFKILKINYVFFHSLNLNVFGAFMHKSVKHSLEYYELIKSLSRKFT